MKGLMHSGRREHLLGGRLCYGYCGLQSGRPRLPVPTTIAIHTPEGLQPVPYRASSLAEAAAHEPKGVYTITRTYRGQGTVMLDAHFDRLEESARLEGIPLRLDREALRRSLRTLVHDAAYPNARFRMTVPMTARTHVILTLEPLEELPISVRNAGVSVATYARQRRNPRAKINNWIEERRTIRATLPADAYEGILLDSQDRLLEGLSSNFYAVREGVLYTAEDGVLEGVARRIVLGIATEIIDIVRQPLPRREIHTLVEAFLTSSSRGVVPIVRIDGQQINTGRPGPITRRLAELYDDWVEAHLEPI